ncbi:CheR family methyltransferase [Sphingomonas adhaesiva]|uniref:CheR family methyltransferase n=1 Tax=Sphingomonas adhaesiva TaxID=28212 RepID=UPI002FF72BC7
MTAVWPAPVAIPSATAEPRGATVLGALLEQRTGQRIAENRSWRIDTALKPLLSALSLDRVEQLTALLRGGRDTALADQIVDLLLNQETSFFRDVGMIEAAATAARAAEERNGMAARIWCAACATGQEPLSLAMLFAEDGAPPPPILATDVSIAAITRARRATYNQFEIQRGLPIRRMMRWFASADEQQWAASSRLLETISYRRHNLVADPAPVGTFDLILCRNVLFYLVPERREQVLDRLAGALAPGGLLLLGAGETVIGQTERLRPSTRLRGFYEVVPA